MYRMLQRMSEKDRGYEKEDGALLVAIYAFALDSVTWSWRCEYMRGSTEQKGLLPNRVSLNQDRLLYSIFLEGICGSLHHLVAARLVIALLCRVSSASHNDIQLLPFHPRLDGILQYSSQVLQRPCREPRQVWAQCDVQVLRLIAHQGRVRWTFCWLLLKHIRRVSCYFVLLQCLYYSRLVDYSTARNVHKHSVGRHGLKLGGGYEVYGLWVSREGEHKHSALAQDLCEGDTVLC